MELKLPNAQQWESGELGSNIETMAVAPDEVNEMLDGFSKSKAISIRLPNDLLGDLKAIASFHEKGYQPLIKDILARWVAEEKKFIAKSIKDRDLADSKPKRQSKQKKEAT